MMKSLFATLFLGVSCNIPIFTNDASLNTKNFVSFFDCSQQILYSESQIPLENLYFVPWSALSLENYIIQCPENPIYSELPRDLEQPFLLFSKNGSISNFNGQVIVALKENHQPLTLQKRQGTAGRNSFSNRSLFQKYVFFNTATFLAFLTVGILLIILFFGIRILSGIQSPSKFEIKKN